MIDVFIQGVFQFIYTLWSFFTHLFCWGAKNL